MITIEQKQLILKKCKDADMAALIAYSTVPSSPLYHTGKLNV